jgi:tetratricopeptide (TPR) repeat protein/transcriptional regulator with XRE-family HTH domain
MGMSFAMGSCGAAENGLARDDPRLGTLLREWRQRALLTQEQLAERTGLHVRTVRGLESGSPRRPRTASVRLLAEALGLDTAERAALVSAARSVPARLGRNDRAAAEPGSPASPSRRPGTGWPASPALLASTAPRAARTSMVPAQLPMAVAGFTGRSRELAQLDALLDPATGPAVVISAVSGTAGVGKTALAVHWAHQRRDRFPDGQLYVNLRGYDPGQPVTAANALARLLTALGVPEPDIPLDVDERAARFRTVTAGRRMLVLLDNASSVEHVRPLLPGHPSCAVLVTSRDSLAGLVAVNGADRIDLDLLTESDSIALLYRLIGDRVTAEPAAAAALARGCGRLPLALRVAAELAAALPGNSLADLVADLDDRQHRLDLLDPGGDPRAAVREVFSWSVRYLPADAARVFALLGLPPGPDIDLWATAALAGIGPGQAGHALDLLTRAHLVHRAGVRRWGLHDLLRAYAADLARTHHPDECRPALDRLFDHYLATASAAMQILYPAEAHHRPQISTPATAAPVFADPEAGRRWLDAERSGLAAVAAYTAVHGWPGHAILLSPILFRYLYMVGGHLTDALAIHGHARDAARRAGDPAGEARALLGIGAATWQTGRHEDAIDHIRRSLALFGQAGDEVGRARAMGNLATVFWLLGRHGPAAEHYQQALALYRRTGDRTGEANSLTNLGKVELQIGRSEQAAHQHSQALALARQAANRVVEATALTNLATTEVSLGRYEQAVTHNDQSLALFRALGSRAGEASVLTSLGVACTGLGRTGEATEHHRHALALFQQNGERYGEASAHNGLGEAASAAGQPSGAIVHHLAALTTADETGARDQQARAHDGLGHAYHVLGDPDGARRHYEHAVELYAALASPIADQIRARLAALDPQRPRERPNDRENR